MSEQKALTPGEVKVLRTYCEKETHADAAAELGISVQTLKNHLGSIYRKTGARKAHSALYKMCVAAGFDPFDSTVTTSSGAEVISEGTSKTAETAQKAPESPGQYLEHAETAAIDGEDTQL